jgi:hypothetical protein
MRLDNRTSVIARANYVIGPAEPPEESLSQRGSHGPRRLQKRDPIHRVEDAVKPLMLRNLVRLSAEALRSLLLTKGTWKAILGHGSGELFSTAIREVRLYYC